MTPKEQSEIASLILRFYGIKADDLFAYKLFVAMVTLHEMEGAMSIKHLAKIEALTIQEDKETGLNP